MTSARPARAGGESTPRGPRPVDRKVGKPLWSQVYDDLLRRLAAGEFEGAFPGELALVEDYAVSRHTIREALRRLRNEGRVSSGRGRTSRVSPPSEIEQPLGALYSLFTAVRESGQAQRSTVRALRLEADGVVATRLGLEESTPLVYLERVRLAGGSPLAVDRVWMPAPVAAPLLGSDFTRTSLYAELADKCGIRLSDGTETVRAVEPTPHERRMLGMGEVGAAFAIERIGIWGARPVEWRHTLVRGDRFALKAAFSSEGGYRIVGLPQTVPQPLPGGSQP